MFYIKIADLTVLIKNKFEYIEFLCRDYLVPPVSEPELVITATDAEIAAEQTENYPNGYLESLAIYRKIADKIIDYNGLLMHSAVIDVNGTGIAFLAPSGTGKTTHSELWQRLFKDRLTVVNGDKPLLRIFDNSIKAYGTPWCGKEQLQTNTHTNLKKICFIERDTENSCEMLNKDTVLERLLNQIYFPSDIEKTVKILDMADALIKNCDFYVIKCNTDISAAEVASEVVL